MSLEKNINLYNELLNLSAESISEYTKNLPTFESQFYFQKINMNCYEKMYFGKRNDSSIIPRHGFFPLIHDLEDTCKKCWNWFLSPRNRSRKGLDVQYGKKFEAALRDFFGKNDIMCSMGDTKKKNYPDNVVFNKKGEIVAYFEVKYLAAPFVKTFQFRPGRECYEGSTTLDVGKKIETQRDIVENEVDVPVFYVYWIDYPCIKGVFYMSSKEVYDYIDKIGSEWDRKERTGDFIKGNDGVKKKIGHTKKVYLPLLQMGTFEELFVELNHLSRD